MIHTLRIVQTLSVCALALGVSVFGLGCEDQSAPPPPTKGQGLSKLSETPQSILGKAAKSGKDLAGTIGAGQDQASALADEVSGQASVAVIGGLEFRPPSAWTKTQPASSMQLAAYKVGEGGALCVFLTGISGSVEDNVARWKKAVTDPGTSDPAPAKVRTQTVQGIKVTLVTMNGTYSSMVSGTPTPQPGSGFRGAIVEGPSGNVFVRLTGPEAEVESATREFEQLVFGVRKP